MSTIPLWSLLVRQETTGPQLATKLTAQLGFRRVLADLIQQQQGSQAEPDQNDRNQNAHRADDVLAPMLARSLDQWVASSWLTSPRPASSRSLVRWRRSGYWNC